MKPLLTLLLLFFYFGCPSQKIEKFNLGFESQTDESSLSDDWFEWGNYKLSIET